MSNAFIIFLLASVVCSVAFAILRLLQDCFSIAQQYRLTKFLIVLFLLSAIIPFFRLDFLILFWLSGVTASFFINVVFAYYILHNVIKGSTKVNDPETLTIVENLQNEMRVNTTVKLYRTLGLSGPATTGLFNLTILLPNINYSNQELTLLLRRQFIYYKSIDLLFYYATVIVKILHWFNPVIYLFIKDFYHISASACDNKIFCGLPRKQQICYAELILRMVENNIADKTCPNDVKNLKKRLKNIVS